MSHPPPVHKPVYKGANLIPMLFSTAVVLFIWFWPAPSGTEQKAWHLFAIFAGLIVGLISKAMPMGAISFLALTLLIITNTLTIKEAFSGFSHPIIWLVVTAFFLSRSFIKTGLGMRLACHLIALLGKKTLGLGYGIAATELILAPVIPSNTARSGGVIYPVVRALAISFGSSPERHSQRLIGGFLILTAYYANLITSAMFITAMAANPLIVGILQQFGLSITWGQWALAASVPGLMSLTIVPYLVYKFYPPEIKDTPEAKQIAHKHLEEMGEMTRFEWLTMGIFAILILLWMFGEPYLGLESTTVALIGVCALVLTGVLTWNDIKQEHEAWDVLVWFSTILMMAGFLTEFGLIKWMSDHIQNMMQGMPWMVAWPFLTVLYFYSHYLFASNTAHVMSMYAAFLSVGIALQIPPYLIALSLGFCSSLYACLTHYGTGCAPILFGSEYVNLKTWWRMGAFISVVFLFIWVGVGSLWWKVLGHW